MIKPTEPKWLKQLQEEFEQPYMGELQQFIEREVDTGATVYPAQSDIFNALNCIAFDKVKVVILGQDPYHGAGQAHGLTFSVTMGAKALPSLKNIFKELERDLGFTQPGHGCLEFWAEQGVLLLNTVLTVEQGKAASHQNRGWEIFTDKVIECLNSHPEGLVFMLWGSHAHKKGKKLDSTRHCVLQSVHPSPLSAYRGFIGCGHFSSANQFLLNQGRTAIDWQLPVIETPEQIALI